MDITKFLGLIIVVSVLAGLWFSIGDPIPSPEPITKKKKPARKKTTPKKKKKQQ